MQITLKAGEAGIEFDRRWTNYPGSGVHTNECSVAGVCLLIIIKGSN